MLALSGSTSTPQQTTVDGRHIVFTASADQDTTDINGTPLLTGYSLEIFAPGRAAPIETVNLGKPAPGADGTIMLDFVALLSTPLTPGVTYEAVVRAVGPYGSSASQPSNPFRFTARRVAGPTLKVAQRGAGTEHGKPTEKPTEKQ